MTDNNVSIGPRELGAVEETEEDSVNEYLGHLVFSTTGEALVPRTWLQEKWEEYGLPASLMPKQPSRWSAYRRAMNTLLDDSDVRNYRVYNDEYQRDFACQFNLEKSDEMGSNVFLLYTEVFYPEELIGEEGGDWRRQRIGHFNFKSFEDDMPGQLVMNTDIEKESPHWEPAKTINERARELFKTHQTHNNHSDLQKIAQDFRSMTNAVAIRRAVHFVGNQHDDVVTGLAKVWEEMNQFKEDGEEMRIEKTPVINIESQRQMVSERVEEKVEKLVDNIVEETLDSFAQDDEQTAQETSQTILEQLSEAYDIQANYNTLLSMRMSVEEILKEQREEMKDEQEEIINNVLKQSQLGDSQ